MLWRTQTTKECTGTVNDSGVTRRLMPLRQGGSRLRNSLPLEAVVEIEWTGVKFRYTRRKRRERNVGQRPLRFTGPSRILWRENGVANQFPRLVKNDYSELPKGPITKQGTTALMTHDVRSESRACALFNGPDTRRIAVMIEERVTECRDRLEKSDLNTKTRVGAPTVFDVLADSIRRDFCRTRACYLCFTFSRNGPASRHTKNRIKKLAAICRATVLARGHQQARPQWSSYASPQPHLLLEDVSAKFDMEVV